MHKDVTRSVFEIYYLEGWANYRILFGVPDDVMRIDRKRLLGVFSPNKTVGYLRWRANEFGTQTWRCFIVKTADVGAPVTRIPGVTPGANILLSTRGNTYTKRFLKYFDALSKQQRPLEFVPDAYWRQLHLRLHLNMAAHDLNEDQWSAGAVKYAVRR